MLKTLAKISAIIVLTCALLLSGCSQEFRVAGGPAADAEVSSNGGLVVKKGGYLYFVNGLGSTSDDNTFGKPVQGSIARMNLSDKNDIVTVVPKVVLSSYASGGFYIFNDKIYYTSPSVEKDKDGNKLTSYLDYFYCNLDGSGTVKIMTTVSNSNAYKFFLNSNDGKVYIIFIASDPSDETSRIYLAPAVKDGKRSVILDKYTNTPVFADDGYVYFNQNVFKDKNGNGTIDEEETDTEGYNRLARMKFSGESKDDIVITGGTSVVDEKFVITLKDVKVFDNKTTVFYTKKSADGISSPVLWPEPFSMSYTLGESSERIIAATSETNKFDFTDRLYVSAVSFFGVYSENLYYVTNDYTLEDPFKQLQLIAKPSKLLFERGDYLYYLNAGGDGETSALFKKQYKGADDLDLQMGTGEQVLDGVSISTSNLMPEIVDGFLYFIRSDGDYTNYVYRYNIDGGATEAELVSIIADEDKVD